ncbi:hypothetical protein AB0K60_25470 [Thermopolyspora sp. NPDC052614]|uniref:hypothetical protein n=1 Tax=Thermopolyspora sp. NPDC052614 TaxID=3155682 RepID=UPI00342C1B9B
MCERAKPISVEPKPGVQTFTSDTEFLAALRPGMDLCTSDFTGWAEVEGVIDDGDTKVVVGRVYEDGRRVHVPAAALIDIRENHCVRVDRVRDTIDRQGWEVAAR